VKRILLALALLASACDPAGNRSSQSTTTTATPPPPASSTTTSSTTAPVPEPTHVGTPDFLDARVGWASVVRPCGPNYCPVLHATEDGGLTWEARTERPLEFQGGFDPVVRLATREIGWQFDGDRERSERLLSTTDGGRTWRDEAVDGQVVSLEAHGRSVWRLEGRCAAQLKGCRYTLRVSGDYGRSWSPASAQPPASDGDASLIRPSASVAYVLSDRSRDEDRAGEPVLARTTDGGRSWTTVRLPCAGYRGGREDLAASLPTDLWFVCYDEPGSGAMAPKHLYRSRDGGAHWSADLGTPNLGAGGSTAAGSPRRACRGSSRTGISCTRDGGRTWFYPIPGDTENPRDGGVGVLEFVDENHAWALGQDEESGGFDVLWRTTDGGESWSPSAVAPEGGRLWLIPDEGPVGTAVRIVGQNCYEPGSTQGYLVFQSPPATDLADDIGEVQIEPRTRRFETRYRIPAQLHAIQRVGGGATTPADYQVVTKPPPACSARFFVMRQSNS
jgi:photosystem II stability/assembly factor-like uncharacterized protein